MTSSATSETEPAPVRPTARTVLEVSGLGCSIGGARIVSELSLAVSEGEFIAVIGPNGAGKTTLFNLLSGLVRVTEGTIALDGRDITHVGIPQRATLGLGRTFQSSSIFPELSVEENVRLAAQAKLGGSLRIWQRVRRSDPAYDRAVSALDRVDLRRRAQVGAGSLSHGEKRKLELAILLASDPRVVLLDEPMAGVSLEDIPELKQVIAEVNRAEGRTVLMVEHHMDVLLDLADRVAVMHHGTLLALDTPSAVVADPAVQTAYLGESL